jgi:hypothetical protein
MVRVTGWTVVRSFAPKAFAAQDDQGLPGQNHRILRRLNFLSRSRLENDRGDDAGNK